MLTAIKVTIMRGTLIATLAACFGVAVLFGPKPALSMPANATLAEGKANAGMVQDVAKKYRYSRNWNRRPYYRGYSYRYRPYGYYRPYYRPYAYYGYPYYYRRPGISLWFGL